MNRRILHIIETRGPGGAEIIYLALVTGMAQMGFISFPCITGGGWVYDNLVSGGYPPIVVSTNGPADLVYLNQLTSLVKRKNIGLIHSHLLGANFYAGIVGRLLGIPVLATFHGAVDKGSHQGRLIPIKMLLISLCASRLVCVSKSLKNELSQSKFFSKRKSIVIYNGIDLAKFKNSCPWKVRARLGFNEKDILIGAVGNIRAAKGYPYLIESAKIIKETLPNVKYLIVGDAPLEDLQKLKNLANALDVIDVVHFLGLRNDVPDILKCLDLFIVPSISEGFSLATIEALASGVPVVATRSGGPEEILTHTKDCLLVPPRDPIALSEATLLLLKNKHLASSLVSGGRKTAEKFSLSAMLHNYKKIYNELLTK